ncbi:unnamed protein product [Polarella glacialis]|uniref:Uncharacterized protein n=1 Tax=Polarella glacialis TaxID=89957 RepID=A0A813LU55_POLGL|nr:unnamed protein product [Polarella glacialis]
MPPKAKIGTSYYKTVNGVKYDRELLEKAEKAAADGQVSVKEAQELWKAAQDGQGVTKTERRTLEYVLKVLKFTEKAAVFLQEQLQGKKKETSYYKIVDGVKYDRELLEQAEQFVKDGQISIAEAQALWEAAHDGTGMTEVEKHTLEHVLKTMKCTKPAAEFLQKELSGAAIRLPLEELPDFDEEMAAKEEPTAADGEELPDFDEEEPAEVEEKSKAPSSSELRASSSGMLRADSASAKPVLAEAAARDDELGESVPATVLVGDATFEAARAGLRRALEAQSIESLQAASSAAAAAGMPESELALARAAMQDQLQKLLVLSSLEKACTGRDCTDLVSSIELAEARLSTGERLPLASGRRRLAAASFFQPLAKRARRLFVGAEPTSDWRRFLSSQGEQEPCNEVAGLKLLSSGGAVPPSSGDLGEFRRDSAPSASASRASWEELDAAVASALQEARATLQEEDGRGEARAAAKLGLARALEAPGGERKGLLLSALEQARRTGLPEPELVQEAESKLLEEERRGALQESLDARDEVRLIEALAEAEAAGLPASELAAARAVLQEVRVAKASQALTSAVEAPTLPALLAAMQTARAVGLKSSDMENAREALATLQRKAALQRAIEDACQKQDVVAIRAALQKAEAEGFSEEVDTARVMLKHFEEERETASACDDAKTQLAQAIESADVDLLEAALAVARSVGLPGAELAAAEAVLQPELRRRSAGEALQTEMLLVRQGRSSADAEALHAALSEAEAAGVASAELAEAKSALADEQHKLRLRAAEAVLAQALRSRNIAALQSALAEAREAGLPLSKASDAQEVLQKEERKMTACQALTSACQLRDLETLKAAIHHGRSAAFGTGVDGETSSTARSRFQGAVRNLMQSARKRARHATSKPDDVQSCLEQALEAAETLVQEEESRAALRQQATTKLTLALEPPLSVDSLLLALYQAKEAGVPESQLATARACLQELQRQSEAERRLGDACASGEESSLLSALAEAEAAFGLSDSDSEAAFARLTAAARLRLREVQQVGALQQLAQAVAARSLPELRALLRRCEELGAEESELQRSARAILAEEQRLEKARAALDAALAMPSNRDRLLTLEDALEEAERAGLPDDQMELAMSALEGELQLVKLERQRQRARQGLIDALAARPLSVSTLADVIAKARLAGLQENEFRETQQALDEERRKAAARVLLQEASALRDQALLSSALQEAEAAGLDEVEIQAARVQLEELERIAEEVRELEQRQSAALEKLAEAIASRQDGALRAALSEARASGLSGSGTGAHAEVATAEALLQELLVADARRALAEALAVGELPLLLGALEKVRAAPGLAEELRQVQAAVEQERRREAARTGLEDACRSSDLKLVAAALQEAQAAGLQDEERVVQAAKSTQKLLEAEKQRQEDARTALSEALNALHACPGNLAEFQSLQAALTEARACGLSESELEDAGKCTKEAEDKQEQTRAAKEERLTVERDLEAAVQEAEAAGMEPDEVEAANAVLLSTRQDNAREDLAEAVATSSVPELTAAIARGRDVGLEATELAAAEAALEAETNRSAARAALADARDSCDIPSLEAAIRDAESAGLREAEIAAIRVLLTAEQKKQARSLLAAAMVAPRNVASLSSAIAAATAAALPMSESIAAQSALQKEKQKEAAQQRLQRAMDSRKEASLISALAEAEAVGLAADVLDRAQTQLTELRQATARSRLADAMGTPSILLLEAAIAQGLEAGLEEVELADARAALKMEQKKSDACTALAAACASCDIPALEAALREGELAGLVDSGLTDARSRLEDERNKLERKKAARSSLAQAVESQDIDSLEAALVQAQDAGLPELELSTARAVLQEEKEKKAAQHQLEEAITATSAWLSVCAGAAEHSEPSASMVSVEKLLRVALAKAKTARVEEDLLSSGLTHLTQLQQAIARSNLAAAVETQTISSLEAAIAHGQAVGLDEVEFADAEVTLEAERRKCTARAALEEACGSRDMASVEASLREAELAGLVEEEDLVFQATRSHLDSERQKAAAKQALAEAVGSEPEVAPTSQVLEALLAEAVAAELEEPELEQGRAHLAEAMRRECRAQLVAAVAAPAIEVLQAALGRGEALGLEPLDLLEAQGALSEAIRSHWQALITADPFELGLESLLANLGDVLRMGFPRDFLREAVLRKVAAAEGFGAVALALSLEQLRNEFEYFPGTLDAVSQEDVEEAFMKGIEQAAGRTVLASASSVQSEVSADKEVKRDSAILWLDLSPSPQEAAEAIAVARPLPSGVAESKLPLLGSSCRSSSSFAAGACLEEVAPSKLLQFSLHEAQGESSKGEGLQASGFDENGDLLWTVDCRSRELMDGGRLVAALRREASSSACKSSTSAASSRKVAASSWRGGRLFLYVERLPPEVFAICITANREAKDAFIRAGELQTASALVAFDALVEQGRRAGDADLTELLSLVEPKLGIAPTQCDLPAIVMLARCQGVAGGWVMDSVGQHTEESGDLGELVRARSRLVKHLEKQLTCVSDPDLPARLRCWEFFRSLQESGVEKVRCIATGVLWRTGQAGAVEVRLGLGILQDLRSLAAVACSFRDEPLPAELGFRALDLELRRGSRAVLSCPGERGLLVRLGRVPEMPVPSIRGTYGWDKTWLTALDVRGALGLPEWLQTYGQSGEALPLILGLVSDSSGSLKWAQPLEDVVQQLFLCGRLASSPRCAPSGAGPWLLSTEQVVAASQVDISDIVRYVLWLPCAEISAQLLLKGLLALQLSCSTKRKRSDAGDSAWTRRSLPATAGQFAVRDLGGVVSEFGAS